MNPEAIAEPATEKAFPEWLEELALMNGLHPQWCEKAFSTVATIMENLASSDFVTEHGEAPLRTLSDTRGYFRDMVLDVAKGMAP